MKERQQTTDNGQQTLSIPSIFRLLLLALSFIPPFYVSAQKEVDLEVTIPEKWQIDSIFLSNDVAYNDWWKKFNDPLLDSLITVALNNNHNIHSIEATLEKSRLLYQQSKSAFYPSLSFDAQYDLSKSSLNYYEETSSDEYRTNGYLNAGINASWEIDVFGKNRDNVRANKKSYYANEVKHCRNRIMFNSNKSNLIRSVNSKAKIL